MGRQDKTAVLDLQDELPMEGWLNVTKSIGGNVSVPMATTRESADDMGEESGSCQSVCGGVPACHGGIVLCFP